MSWGAPPPRTSGIGTAERTVLAAERTAKALERIAWAVEGLYLTAVEPACAATTTARLGHERQQAVVTCVAKHPPIARQQRGDTLVHLSTEGIRWTTTA